MSNRKAGLIELKVGGTQREAMGNFTYNPGRPKREAIVGADGVHGFKETAQPAFIEGEITDDVAFSIADLADFEEGPVSLKLGNGKVFRLHKAWFAGEGTGNSEDGKIAVRFEAKRGEEV